MPGMMKIEMYSLDLGVSLFLLRYNVIVSQTKSRTCSLLIKTSVEEQQAVSALPLPRAWHQLSFSVLSNQELVTSF